MSIAVVDSGRSYNMREKDSQSPRLHRLVSYRPIRRSHDRV